MFTSESGLIQARHLPLGLFGFGLFFLLSACAVPRPAYVPVKQSGRPSAYVMCCATRDVPYSSFRVSPGRMLFRRIHGAESFTWK